ncbi:hypothetical protein [Nostocoides vanveenii]|uniref:Secreted protein n=1 Tax=Nostocoides vanveenii TaxID=330835 RepID=A0ABP4WEM0_9MICO
MTIIANAPDQAPAPSASAAAAKRRAEARRHYLTGTPGRMRVLAALASLLCVAFAVTGFLGLRAVDAAVDRASANTEQVVRVQSIYGDLLKADAAVTNGFLVGGLESEKNRLTYDSAMADVARNIAEAAKAQPADGTALAALNQAVQGYSNNIDRARTNNRQAFTVGQQYLKIAGDGLRQTALPIAANLASANEARADDELNFAGSGGLVLGMGVLTLGALVGIGLWLARKTHRYVNLPLVGAGVLVAGGLALATMHVVDVSSTLIAVKGGNFKAAVSLAGARAAAFDAKANESLTLIARGNGATYEERFLASADQADKQLDDMLAADTTRTSLKPQFSDYRTLHSKIRDADEGGDWNAAVGLATSTASGSANAVFTTFDEASGTVLDQLVAGVVKDFNGLGGRYLPWVLGLGGILAALLAGRSMTNRIEEYR